MMEAGSSSMTGLMDFGESSSGLRSVMTMMRSMSSHHPHANSTVDNSASFLSLPSSTTKADPNRNSSRGCSLMVDDRHNNSAWCYSMDHNINVENNSSSAPKAKIMAHPHYHQDHGSSSLPSFNNYSSAIGLDRNGGLRRWRHSCSLMKLPKEARQELLEWWSRQCITCGLTLRSRGRWPWRSQAGLDQKQINNWFINQRKQLALPPPLCSELFVFENVGLQSL